MLRLKLVLVVGFVFLLSQKVSARNICSNLFPVSYPQVLVSESILNQLFIRPSLVRRYSNDPFVTNIAHDILTSQGRLLNSGGIVKVRSEVIYGDDNLVELKLFHVRIPNHGIGEVSRQTTTNSAKFLAGLGLAIETLFQEGSDFVNLKFLTIVNPLLLQQLVERLSNNKTFQVMEDFVGDQIQVMIFPVEPVEVKTDL